MGAIKLGGPGTFKNAHHEKGQLHQRGKSVQNKAESIHSSFVNRILPAPELHLNTFRFFTPNTILFCYEEIQHFYGSLKA